MIPSLVSDKRISPSCFRVLCFLATRVDDDGRVAGLAKAKIAESCDMNRETVISALDEAATHGLVTRTFTGGSPVTSFLRFDCRKIPHVEKSSSEPDEDADGLVTRTYTGGALPTTLGRECRKNSDRKKPARAT